MKKILALLMALTLVLSFAACGKKDVVEVTTTPITMGADAAVNADDFKTTAAPETTTALVEVTDESGEVVTDASGEAVTEVITEKTTTLAEKPIKDWTKAEMLYAYNQAVIKTEKGQIPTGQSTMKLAGGITGDGAIGSILEVLSPAAEKALAKNSTPTDFIPGYGELRGEDLKAIQIIDNGKTYTIEMTVKSQTDGPDADDKAGPVGRAIGTLGSIEGALKELGASFKSGRETVSLTYDDVSIRAEIDKTTGTIVHGQWHYVVKVLVGDAKASISVLTANLKNLRANIDYTVVI